MGAKYHKVKSIGWCYLIKSGNYYKVGITSGSLSGRMGQYKTHNPHMTHVIYAVKTSSYVDLEEYLLNKFFKNESKERRLVGCDWSKLQLSQLKSIIKMMLKFQE